MQKSTEEKLRRINELQKVILDAQVELENLLQPEKSVLLPADFSMNTQVFEVIKSSGEKGIELQSILKTLQGKFPRYGLTRGRVASSLAYLKNTKKLIEKIGRGLYKTI